MIKYILIFSCIATFSCNKSINGSNDCIADNCGVCDYDISNDCIQDCSGEWGGFVVEDCAGECGGSAVEDNCGVCDNNSSNDCLYDCFGDYGGIAVEDCAGVCGGTAVEDCAGECSGLALVDYCGTCDVDLSNDCIPSEFVFNNSPNYAAVLFNSVVIQFSDGNIPIENSDWVGAFNGDICVGSRQWNTTGVGACNNGICDVVVMGNDGSGLTDGYLNNGDVPTFKVYDISENMYYEAEPTTSAPFGFLEIYSIDELLAQP